MVNSQIERDFNDQSALKRPGRLDFRTLNLVDDAGDGYPGLQQAIINRMKLGSDTSVHFCTTLAEIVAAIADIGTGSGLIFIINNKV